MTSFEFNKLDKVHGSEIGLLIDERSAELADIRTPYSATHKDRQEHTLLGAVIGCVRDSIISAPADGHQRLENARSNDELAHIAADTISALPHVGPGTAAIARAGLLFDINATTESRTVGGVLLNFRLQGTGAGFN